MVEHDPPKALNEGNVTWTEGRHPIHEAALVEQLDDSNTFEWSHMLPVIKRKCAYAFYGLSPEPQGG